MARRLRQPTASRYWYLGDRCQEEKFFLRPDPEVNRVVLRAIRRAIEATGVEILFFVVMGNHWHLGVYVPDHASLSKFMQLLRTDVAVEINEHLGRHGTFWDGRFKAFPMLDEASLFERMMYTLMNPVAAGVVADAAEYPGLSSLEANLGIRGACEAVDLPIRPVPQWAELDAESSVACPARSPSAAPASIHSSGRSDLPGGPRRSASPRRRPREPRFAT